MPKTYTNLRSVPLSQLQKDFLIGAILGDSCLYKESKTPRLTIAHSIKQLPYFNYKLNLLSPYIAQAPKTYVSKTRNSTTIQTSTITHPEFLPYYNLFYNPTKFISPDLIHYLTPLSLAIWVQDDGS